ncbi:hypothetical protein BV96_01254 [Sphingomonas paucimobilis]|nr:hypothetical protein BV96_01254 [Sphingomonas paucimobilis]
MLPHHIITAVHFLAINISHYLDFPSARMIGAATFTGSVEHGEVTFQLHATILGPGSPIAALLPWLDDHLDPRATITGFGLEPAAGLLAHGASGAMPGITQALAGRGRQSVLELSPELTDNQPTAFIMACRNAGLPCSAPDDNDFAAWMTRRPVPLIHRLELDVISVWRMAMARIGARTSLGAQVGSLIEQHLIDWLRAADFPAGAIQLASLSATEG